MPVCRTWEIWTRNGHAVQRAWQRQLFPSDGLVPGHVTIVASLWCSVVVVFTA